MHSSTCGRGHPLAPVLVPLVTAPSSGLVAGDEVSRLWTTAGKNAGRTARRSRPTPTQGDVSPREPPTPSAPRGALVVAAGRNVPSPLLAREPQGVVARPSSRPPWSFPPWARLPWPAGPWPPVDR